MSIVFFSYDKPAHKIMDKIAEQESDVCMVVVSTLCSKKNTGVL